ncbi:MAG: hypothetical protein K0R94_1307, partial [Burkholderiales bacterium]|nr:hypothetical protein [Burkholderiales bacterium]
PIRNDFYRPFYIIEKGRVRKTTTEILKDDDWNGYTDHCKTTNTDYEYIDKSMITMVDMRYVELKAHYNPANPNNNYWEVIVDDQSIYKTSMTGYPDKLKPYVHLNVQQWPSGTVISATIGTQDGNGINDMPLK